jgi:hypothetical protein
MNADLVKTYAQNLLFLYVELIAANDGYKHDPEAHNLCSAVCEMSDGVSEYVSYSNPSGLAVNVRKYVLSAFIPDVKIHNAVIERGGMQDLHTEVRLLNYLHSIGMFDKVGTISFFSTRSVCKTCADAIAEAQRKFARNVAFVPFELKAEDRGQDLSTIYAFLAQKGSLGARRDTSGQQGSTSMEL